MRRVLRFFNHNDVYFSLITIFKAAVSISDILKQYIHEAVPKTEVLEQPHI
jgi:hypothetical protein